jgi:hypothetical protein
MKMRILIIAMLVIVCSHSNAQIITSLFVGSTPNPQLALWGNRPDILTYQVLTTVQGVGERYKIKTELSLVDGTIVGRNDLAKAGTYTLGNSSVTYNANQVLPLENMIFNADIQSALNKTGKLPPNNYRLCVQLVFPGGQFQPISQLICRTFYVAQLQLPILMKPSEEEMLDGEKAKTSVMFRWTPLVPKPATPVTYKILVFEILPNQNAVQAMRSNNAILEASIPNTTQYIWQPQGILSDPYRNINGTDTPYVELNGAKFIKRNYVWTIQSLDQFFQPAINGSVNADGVSEPRRFSVLSKVKELSNLPR